MLWASLQDRVSPSKPETLTHPTATCASHRQWSPFISFHRASPDHGAGEMMHPKAVLACPAGITARASRDASLPLQNLGPMRWLSLLSGYSNRAAIPPPHSECKTTSCTIQRLMEMSKVIIGVELPSTQKKQLRGAQVFPPK